MQVRWSDCDPAQIAYTGRIPCFALEAIDAWWEATIGAGWYSQNIDYGLGTPFVHLSVDFRHPVTPRHELVMQVRLIKLGNSSIRFKVAGRQNDVLCFEGEFVEVFVKAGEMSKIGVPEEYRDQLLEKLDG